MSELLVVNEALDLTVIQSVKDRLEGAFDVMIEQAEINPALVKIAASLFTKFMNDTDEQQIVALLTTMRDELLPYILEGDK